MYSVAICVFPYFITFEKRDENIDHNVGFLPK